MKPLVCLAGLLLASTALATTTSCQTGSLSAYLASGFTCQSGGLIFTDFNYQGTGSDASSITVKPLPLPTMRAFSSKADGTPIPSTAPPLRRIRKSPTRFNMLGA